MLITLYVISSCLSPRNLSCYFLKLNEDPKRTGVKFCFDCTSHCNILSSGFSDTFEALGTKLKTDPGIEQTVGETQRWFACSLTFGFTQEVVPEMARFGCWRLSYSPHVRTGSHQKHGLGLPSFIYCREHPAFLFDFLCFSR